MKIYTLEYDCNLPTTLQVNVATNTDAKIGIKVQKNGEYLELDGSTLSVKVGDEIVYDPVTINGTRAELTASTTTTNTTLSTDVAGSDYYGYNVAAKKIKVQISYNGTTWEDATPLTSDIVGYWYDLNVDSRRPKALINMANPLVFNVVFGPDAGKQLTELAWTEKTRIQMNANQYAYWNITSYPCYMRICANFQKPNYQEMLSADAELTNGYVTFPITTPDTASYVQDNVVVNIEPASLSATASKAIPIPAAVKSYTITLPASDLSGAAGMKLYAEDIKLYYSALSSDTTGTEISGYNGTCWYVGVYNSANQLTYGGYIGTNAGIEKKWYKNLTPENILPTYETTPRDFAELQEGDYLKVIISDKANSLPAYTSSEKYTHIDITARKEGFNANFKLNVNGFKSQQGDKEYLQELPYIPSETINIAGTYTDNTPFSYDVYYKD